MLSGDSTGSLWAHRVDIGFLDHGTIKTCSFGGNVSKLDSNGSCAGLVS